MARQKWGKFKIDNEFKFHYLINYRNDHFANFLHGGGKANFIALQNQFHFNSREFAPISEDIHVAKDASGQKIS